MVSNNKSIIFSLGILIVLIGISLMVKINNYDPDPKNTSSEVKVATKNQKGEPQKLDPNFVEDSKVSASSKSAGKTIGQTIKKPAVVAPVGIPGVTAFAYLVGDLKTGKIYLEKNSSVVVPVASMSKLVTAFVATDMFSATSTITITEKNLLAPPDWSNLFLDEKFTLEEILQPLLLSSSNIAAEAVSSSVDQKNFLELMRGYAWEVGMPHSFFADPSGVSPKNVASAEDLFGLAKYLMYYRPDILAITRTASTSMATTTEHGSHQIVSTHPFVNNPNFIGGKTGRTQEAGETMMTILDISNQPITFVILGARYGSRESDTRILLKKVEEIIAQANSR